jgi:hypothetical protein
MVDCQFNKRFFDQERPPIFPKQYALIFSTCEMRRIAKHFLLKFFSDIGNLSESFNLQASCRIGILGLVSYKLGLETSFRLASEGKAKTSENKDAPGLG